MTNNNVSPLFRCNVYSRKLLDAAHEIIYNAVTSDGGVIWTILQLISFPWGSRCELCSNKFHEVKHWKTRVIDPHIKGIKSTLDLF